MPILLSLRTARACFSVALFALSTCPIATFAGPVEPPMELLYQPQNQLVAGPLLDINPNGRLVFQRKDVLGGKGRPPEQIDVRAPKAILDAVKRGERYIFGYAASRADPRNPTHVILDPLGPVLLTSIGLEPALFRDTPETRALLKAGRSEHGRESRRFFELLMQALAGKDPALQLLAAGEIAQDPEVRERVRENGAVVERVARAPGTPVTVRSTLLLAAATRPSDFGSWWQDVAVNIVATTPTGGYTPDSSDPTGLVLLAFEELDKHAVRVPSDALERWVGGDTPLLAERASLMLRRESPARERSAIQKALADPKTPAQTRKFLGDHLRRLDRLETGQKAREDGTG